MYRIRFKLSAACAIAMSAGVPTADAADATDTRVEALEEIREAREGTRAATAAELPALVRAMNDRSASASRVPLLIQGASPTSRLFVEVVTAGDARAAAAAAERLITEIFTADGHAADKLFLTQTNVARLATENAYDVATRARVTYLDTLITQRLHRDRTGEVRVGDAFALVLTTAAAAWGGTHGTRRLTRAWRRADWSALVRDAHAGAAAAPGRLVRRGLAAIGGVRAFALARLGRRASKGSRIATELEVASLLEGAAGARVSPGLRRHFALSTWPAGVPVPVAPTRPWVETRVPGLFVAVEHAFVPGSPDGPKRLFVRRDAGAGTRVFATRPLDATFARDLVGPLVAAVPGASRVMPLGRRLSAEAREALVNLNARGAALARRLGRFDLPAAAIDGAAVGVPAFAAGRLGFAGGFARGEDLAATHLEAIIPPDRREPLELDTPEAE